MSFPEFIIYVATYLGLLLGIDALVLKPMLKAVQVCFCEYSPRQPTSQSALSQEAAFRPSSGSPMSRSPAPEIPLSATLHSVLEEHPLSWAPILSSQSVARKIISKSRVRSQQCVTPEDDLDAKGTMQSKLKTLGADSSRYLTELWRCQ